MKLEGIHHITCITGDAPRNVDFYARVMGLRMVKKTVNQDQPTIYHLFYGDEEGSPGHDLTFFEFPGAAPGKAGAGMVHRLIHRVGSTDALDFWADRLGGEGIETKRENGSLVFADPEGLEHELAVFDVPDPPLIAHAAEVPGRARAPGLRGRARVHARSRRAAARCSRRGSAFEQRGDAEWQARGEERGGRIIYDTSDAPGEAGRGHRPPRRVVDRDGRAGGVARARDRRGRTRHADHRPLLVPLDLLPRAERRAVRAGHARARASPPTSRSRRSGEALTLPPDYEHMREQLEGILTPLPDPAQWRRAKTSDVT